jgi:hypothetical protein
MYKQTANSIKTIAYKYRDGNAVAVLVSSSSPPISTIVVDIAAMILGISARSVPEQVKG